MIEYDMLLLRFGEIVLKGRNRSRFEKVIWSHVTSLLRPYSGVELRKEFGRIYIMLNGEPMEEIMDAMKNVFGVASICPVKIAPSRLEDIVSVAVSFMQRLPKQSGTTFKVSGRRVWKAFPHSSQEMNHLVGGPVLKACPEFKVDVHDPEVDLRVEVREQGAYLFCEVIQGAGGFPLGTNGKAMLLLSGGIDSPVAGWSAMRRGLDIECVHFHSYPFTSKKAEEKVIELARVLSRYSGRIKLHLVPFTEIQTEIAKTSQDNLIITLMRRAMLRITTSLAHQQGALALVTGDSLGQVASQTLASMNVIGRVTELPLLRPLVMNDKDEIIRIAHQIGTYDVSILPYEDCCTLFVPKSPTTNPNLRVVERIEGSISNLDDLITQAIQGVQTLVLTPDLDPDKIAPSSHLKVDQKAAVIQNDWF